MIKKRSSTMELCRNWNWRAKMLPDSKTFSLAFFHFGATLMAILLFTATAVYANAPQRFSEIVTTPVTERTLFIFTPQATGYWNFTAPDGGSGAPLLRVHNMYGHRLAAAESWRGQDAHISIHLVAGADYIIEAGFVQGEEGAYILSVHLADRLASYRHQYNAIPGGGGTIRADTHEMYVFVPNTTGFWTFEMDGMGDVSIVDPFWNGLASIMQWGDGFAMPISVHLVGGVEYKINIFPSFESNRNVLSVSPGDTYKDWWMQLAYEEMSEIFDEDIAIVPIASAGGVLEAAGNGVFSFVPNATGPWSFTAYGFGADGFTFLTDSYGSFLVHDDFSIWRDEAELVAYLAEGVKYVIRFIEEISWGEWSFYAGDFNLSVAPYIPRAEHAASVTAIPSDGGRVTITATAQEFEDEWSREVRRSFSFTPKETAVWTISGGRNVESIEIIDPSGSFRLSSGWRSTPLTIDLAAGVEYTINVRVWGDSCAIYITRYHQLHYFTAGEPTQRNVLRETDFSFIPDVTATWLIFTDNNGMSDPYLWLLDADGNVIASDDDSGGGLNAAIEIRLNAGDVYTIRAGFFGETAGGYRLLVRRHGSNAPERVELPAPAVR